MKNERALRLVNDLRYFGVIPSLVKPSMRAFSSHILILPPMISPTLGSNRSTDSVSSGSSAVRCERGVSKMTEVRQFYIGIGDNVKYINVPK